VLARFRKGIAIEFLGISTKDNPAHPLHRDSRHLPSSGNALQLLPEPLTVDQFTDLNPTGGGKLPQRRLEGAGVQSGAGIGPHNSATRCFPVNGSWPANGRCTASSSATPGSPA
jgi:hypothetical protein